MRYFSNSSVASLFFFFLLKFSMCEQDYKKKEKELKAKEEELRRKEQVRVHSLSFHSRAVLQRSLLCTLTLKS